ncbi:MAG: arginine repressor [Defluviitaleaceae bacterium]|nr:arginine repressor [Defluviitaleaceae bacterium]
MKTKRQDKILEILREKNIYSQEELTLALQESGFSAAQSTISRDIRELGLLRESTPKGQRYIENAGTSPHTRVFRVGLVSVDFAENMLVLRTLSGMAMAVAAALDDMGFTDILGSVAGDDVIICVVRTKEAAARLAERLQP